MEGKDDLISSLKSAIVVGMERVSRNDKNHLKKGGEGEDIEQLRKSM